MKKKPATAKTKAAPKAGTKTRTKPKAKAKPPAAAPPPTLDPAFAAVADAFAGDRDVTVGKMMASIGLKVRGKIFAMMVKGRFVAKLPRDRVDALVAAGNGDYFDPGHGRLMKEWIAMAPSTAPWVELAREAHRYVKTTA